jgi:hypothetical protein
VDLAISFRFVFVLVDRLLHLKTRINRVMSSVVSTSSSPSSVSGKASSCLCAPTTHAGSFRCRLHRTQQSWGRRPLPSSDVDEMFASEVEASVRDVQQTTKQASVAPPSPSSSTSPLPSPSARRTSPRPANRPRLSVTFAEEAQVSVGGQFHSVKMATGTGGSYASKRGARPDLFRMVKTGTTTTNVYL